MCRRSPGAEITKMNVNNTFGCPFAETISMMKIRPKPQSDAWKARLSLK